MLAVPFAVYGGTPVQKINLLAGVDTDIDFGNRFLSVATWNISGSHWHAQAGGSIMPGMSLVSSWHLEAGADSLLLQPLSVQIRLLNRRFHTWQRAENSIQPFISWRGKWFEADWGINIRFLNASDYLPSLIFYFPDDLVQYIWMFRVGFYLQWKILPLRTGLEIKNFDTWYADNGFTLSYHLDCSWEFSPRWTARLKLGLSPAGTTGLSTLYQSFTCLAGMEMKL